MLYTRTVPCSAPGCGQPAEYKIAAPWSAGRFSELKTYGLACATHYPQVYRDALGRRKDHAPSAEEAQGEIAVFRFARGQSGQPLEPVPSPT